MFLGAVGAGPVYRLLGRKDLGTAEFPPIETALVGGDIAFRQHRGGHTAGPNWPTFIDSRRGTSSDEQMATGGRPRSRPGNRIAVYQPAARRGAPGAGARCAAGASPRRAVSNPFSRRSRADVRRFRSRHHVGRHVDGCPAACRARQPPAGAGLHRHDAPAGRACLDRRPDAAGAVLQRIRPRPLTLLSARIARATGGSAIDPATDRALTFGGTAGGGDSRRRGAALRPDRVRTAAALGPRGDDPREGRAA